MTLGVETASDIEDEVGHLLDIDGRIQLAILRRLEAIDETLLELGAKILRALPKEQGK